MKPNPATLKLNLQIAAARLQRANGPGFEDFLQALGAHTSNVVITAINSPLDIAPLTQGHAQQAMEMLDTLRTANAAATQHEERTKQ